MKAPFTLGIFILFLILISFDTYSQDVKNLISKGDKLFKRNEYRKTLPFYEQALKADSNNAEVLFKSGVSYLHRYSKEKALKHLIKAYSLNPGVDKHLLFWLGRAYHHNYQFDRAIEVYSNYKKSLSKSDSRKVNIDKYIHQSEMGKELMTTQQDYFVRNLGNGINTEFSEHSPVFGKGDSLILFTSRRNGSTGNKEAGDEFFEDIFRSEKGKDGQWSKPESIGKNLNSSGHDAVVQLYDQDQRMLIYKHKKGGDIYRTHMENGAWTTPERVENINTRHFEADAYITPDFSTFYYSTNRYNKDGNLDIYYVSFDKNGKCNTPQPLSSTINTKEDEDAPFFAADGKTLYFSSRGHKNLGGYDIFKSTLQADGSWSQPENLGNPINTPDDDVYFSLSANSKKGYYASYREGGFGEKDIYEIIPIAPVIIKGAVTSAYTGSTLSDVTVNFSSQKSSTRRSLSGQTTGDQGNYEVSVLSNNSYKITLLKGADTLHTEMLEIPIEERDSIVITKNFSVEYANPNEAAVLAVSPKNVLRKLYLGKDGTSLNSKSKKELDILAEVLRKNPSAELIIKSKYKNGKDKLAAENRSKLVYDYLKSKGINNKIAVDSVTVARGGKSENTVDFDVKLKAPLRLDLDPKIVPTASVGSSFILRNVYFEMGKDNLLPESKEELNILKLIMEENPTMIIEIGGHTDNTGDEKSNQELSEERAISVVGYLINSGIKEDRLKSKGYGESLPIDTNDTEEGRQINRRTEFKIIKK